MGNTSEKSRQKLGQECVLEIDDETVKVLKNWRTVQVYNREDNFVLARFNFLHEQIYLKSNVKKACTSGKGSGYYWERSTS